MSVGKLNPERNEALTKAPEVVYSLMVPVFSLATKRSLPEMARPSGWEYLGSVISAALIVAPVREYSPTVLVWPLTT